jgi:putative MATE family efflux protein
MSPSLLAMSAPLVVSFTMRQLFSLVDTFYASTLGDSAVAAIGVAFTFEFLMIAIWVGLSTGLTSRLSRAMGARQSKQVDRYVGATWRMIGLVSPGFLALGVGIWFFAPHMELEPDVARDFRIYGSVLVGGSALNAFWSIVPDSIVKAHQDTRSTMWAGIWSNVINLVLNTIFLFVFEWGIFGIALSTVIGRFGGLVYALHRASVHENERRERWRREPTRHDPEPHPYRSILSLSFPSGLTFALMALEVGMLLRFLALTGSSTESLAAYSIFYRVSMFANQPLIATAVAMLPFAARLLGEGDVREIRHGFRQMMLYAAGYYVVIVAPLTLFFGEPLASFLAEEPTTARYATFALWIVPLAGISAIPFFLARPIFEAMGRGRPGLAVAAVRHVLLSLPLAWAGMRVAARVDVPEIYGLLAGVITATLLTSLIIWSWVGSALRKQETELRGMAAVEG